MIKLFAILAINTLLLGGCGLWVSDNIEITNKDIAATDPFDGSKVYPLHIVSLGKGDCVDKFKGPLSLLKNKAKNGSRAYRVISNGDCGILACYANDIKLAQSALSEAIADSESMDTNDANNRSATSLSGTESNKVFKGEPHEKAIMYIYRGLLYMATGDPENAKSCFIQATMSDALAKGEKDRGNWLSADVLATLAFKLYGNDERANDYINMIEKTYSSDQKDFGWVPCDALRKIKKENMTIVVVATGMPPIKSGEGLLEYSDSGSVVASIEVSSDSVCSDAWLADNIFTQAKTRGRRKMDDILNEKDSHKKSVEAAGSVALGVAVAAGGPVGLAVQLVAGLILDANKAIDIDADSRYLCAIPGRIYLWVTNSINENDLIKIELYNSHGKIIAQNSISISNNNDQPGFILAWFPY